MHALQLVRDMNTWLRWCTDRSTTAARALTEPELHRKFEMGLGSVYGTLLHMHGAEKLWLAVLQGTTAGLAMPTEKEVPNLDALCHEWRASRANWDSYLATVDDAELQRVVTRVRDGREYSQRVVDALLQLPTHALYHNAQLSSMFRQMGKELPDSSYIIWARERMTAQLSSAR